VLTVGLFLFIYGGLELIPALRPSYIVGLLDFAIVRLILIFVLIIVVGIVIYGITRFGERAKKD
jgi:hypothetical protein